MRNGFWGNGVGRFVLSCTAISAIGLGIGAFGPGFLAWISKPAQAQDIMVLPKDTKPSAASSVPYMSLVPSAQATRPVQAEMPASAPLRMVAGLSEPLVATVATSPEEDAALNAATQAFISGTTAGKDFPEQAAPLLAYVAKYPASGWNMALLTNLGLGYYRAGYFSRALDAWQQAWQLGRNSTVPEAARLVDRAVSELALMHARIGHLKEVDALLAEIGDRQLSGAAAEFLNGAREGAGIMRKHPEEAYLCGPKALANVLTSLNAAPQQISVAQDARSGPRGFSLTQLDALAGKAGLAHQLIKREPGQPVPVPSIINWKLNHYAAIVAEHDGRYVVQDPTFATGELNLTAEAIDAEGSGYFLVPDGATKSAVQTQAAAQDSTAKTAAPASADWRTVDPGSDEAKTVYGMGAPQGSLAGATTNADKKDCKGKRIGQMCMVSAHTMNVSLSISDPPVGYAPPKGPKVEVRLTYNQREATQPANFPFFNVGQRWVLAQQSYIEDPADNVNYAFNRVVAGGGAIAPYSPYGTGGKLAYSRDYWKGERLKRVPMTGALTRYELVNDDGSMLIYAQQDGATTGNRKVFLSQVVDPQGNALTYNYTNLTGTQGPITCSPSCARLDSITDASGGVTTFTYGLTGYPLIVTKVTDPYGRYTTLTYDASQRLTSITDPAGIVSTVHYDASGYVDTLNTPYGTSSFAFGQDANNVNRWLNITDPLGFTKRIEHYRDYAPGIAASSPASEVPTGMLITNDHNQVRNTFVWDEHVNALYGTTDYTKANILHWTVNLLATTTLQGLESIKKPLENRVWFNLQGSSNSSYSGYYGPPTIVGRVLDDGTTQLTQAEYTTQGGNIATGSLLSTTDPKGRKTVFNYGNSNLDVTSIQQQISATPTYATLATITYNTQHEPLTYTDAAGQVWKYAYNTAGQMIYATNPLSQTTFWEYDSSGRITRVTTPVAVAYASVVYGTTNVSALTAKSYNYSSPCSGVTAPANTNLPISVTDSEGYTLCYQYDALDRVVKVKYPDGTTDQYDYNFPTGWTANGVNYGGTPSLDVWKMTDRLGRIVNYSYDRNRQLISKSETVKVAGVDVTRTTGYAYYENGALKELTDANGAVTHWEIDLQSRPVSKTYAYGTANAKTESYAYDLAGRVKTVTDAKGQITTIARNKDDTVASIAYTNAVVATPGVSFTYDSWYPRRTGMTDQYGTTSWTYKAVGTNGALGLDTEDGPFSNDTVAYGYDAAGRVNSRTIPGGSAESLTYDLLGRLSTHGTDLGSFTYGWLGNGGQVASRTIGSIVTSWGYDTNANDRRLLTISTTGAVGRNFTYTSNVYQLTGITDTAPVSHPWLSQTWSYSYDASDRLLTGNGSIAGNSGFSYDKLDNATTFAGLTGTYDNLNQISTFNGTSYTYDANGNLTSDGTRTYSYDAADRLLTVTQGSAVTTYGYDGLGRRVKRTYVNGTTTNTRYLWCGASICQTRDGSDTVTAKLFAEGEYRPSGTKKYLYLTDHLGSVRDVVDITGTPTLVAAFDYTSYGAIARSYGSVVTLYQYAMLVADPNTGLYLSATRAYSPASGKWLNSDPIREIGSGPNLTGYVGANPINRIDPLGLIGGVPSFTNPVLDARFPSINICLPKPIIEAMAGLVNGAVIGFFTGGPVGAVTLGGYGSVAGLGVGFSDLIGHSNPAAEGIGGVIEGVSSGAEHGPAGAVFGYVNGLASGGAKGSVSGVKAPDNVFVNMAIQGGFGYAVGYFEGAEYFHPNALPKTGLAMGWGSGAGMAGAAFSTLYKNHVEQTNRCSCGE